MRTLFHKLCIIAFLGLIATPQPQFIVNAAGETPSDVLPGNLDGGFGQKGIAIIPIRALVQTVLSDGKVLIAGRLKSPTNGEDSFGFFRLNNDGTVDQSFGQNGAVDTKIPNIYPSTILIQLDGKILIGFSRFIVRFLQTGEIDTSFGNNGFAEAPPDDLNATRVYYPSSIALQLTGDILVAYSTYDFQMTSYSGLWSFNKDGMFDRVSDWSGAIIGSTNSLHTYDDDSFDILYKYGNNLNYIHFNPDRTNSLPTETPVPEIYWTFRQGDTLIGRRSVSYLTNLQNIGLTRIGTNGIIDTTFGEEMIEQLPDNCLTEDGEMSVGKAGTIVAVYINTCQQAQLTRYDINGKFVWQTLIPDFAAYSTYSSESIVTLQDDSKTLFTQAIKDTHSYESRIIRFANEPTAKVFLPIVGRVSQ